MSNRIYEATVIDGEIQLLADVRLPENSRVLVTVSDEADSPQSCIHTPRLVHPGQAEDFQIEVKGPGDAGV